MSQPSRQERVSSLVKNDLDRTPYHQSATDVIKRSNVNTLSINSCSADDSPSPRNAAVVSSHLPGDCDRDNHHNELLEGNGDLLKENEQASHQPPHSDVKRAITSSSSTDYPIHNSIQTNICKSRRLTPRSGSASQSVDREREEDQSAPGDSLIPDGEETKTEPGVQRWAFFLINITLIFLHCGDRLISLVVQLYLYQESARDLTGNSSTKTTRDPCLNDSSSSNSSILSQVSNLAASRMLNLDLASYGLAIIANLVLGVYSNVLSRRCQLGIPLFGHLTCFAITTGVIFWNLDVRWLLVGYAMDGLSGGVIGVAFGGYLYTTDVTPPNRKRTLGVAILEATKGIASASMNVVAGDLIEETGFFTPAIIATGLLLASISLVFFLPNHRPRLELDSGNSRYSPSRACRSMGELFSKNRGNAKKMVILGCLSFAVIVMVHIGISKIRPLVFMDLPFCWDAGTIGWVLFGRDVIVQLVVVVAVVFLHERFPGMTLAVFGCLSYVAGLLMYAFATLDVELYIVPAIGMGQSLPMPLLRGEVSRLLDSSQQGPLFAFFAVLEAIAFMTGALYLKLYQATLSFYPRPPFVASAAIIGLLSLLLVWFQILWRRHRRQPSYQTLN